MRRPNSSDTLLYGRFGFIPFRAALKMTHALNVPQEACSCFQLSYPSGLEHGNLNIAMAPEVPFYMQAGRHSYNGIPCRGLRAAAAAAAEQWRRCSDDAPPRAILLCTANCPLHPGRPAQIVAPDRHLAALLFTGVHCPGRRHVQYLS
jgi:hypothetical protein